MGLLLAFTESSGVPQSASIHTATGQKAPWREKTPACKSKRERVALPTPPALYIHCPQQVTQTEGLVGTVTFEADPEMATRAV